MGEPMMGQIMAFGGNYNPEGWAYCNGGLLNVGQYSALYSIMGTIYGGDGRTTFGVPDLRGRSPLGMGDGPMTTPRLIGTQGGAETVTLYLAQMPSHSHSSAAQITGEVTATAHCATTPAEQSSPAASTLAQQGLSVPADAKVYTRNPVNATMDDGFITTENNLDVEVAVAAAGGDTAHPNMHPWSCLNYIIALEGYYPTRS